MHRVRVISAEIPVGSAVTGVGIIAGAFAVWHVYRKKTLPPGAAEGGGSTFK